MGNSVVRLQLWDIAGQERFGNMTRVYYKEAVGAFVVFDVTRVSTFEAVQKWKSDMDAKVFLSDNRPIPCIAPNKCDLAGKEGICQDRRQMDKFCEENGFIGWFETSAKSSVGIEDAAKCLVGKILEDSPAIPKKESDSIKISRRPVNPPPKEEGVCC